MQNRGMIHKKHFNIVRVVFIRINIGERIQAHSAWEEMTRFLLFLITSFHYCIVILSNPFSCLIVLVFSNAMCDEKKQILPTVHIYTSRV